MATYFDLIKSGTDEYVIEELVKIMRWARCLTKAEWNAINADTGGGLRSVVRNVMSQPVNKNFFTDSPHSTEKF